MQQAIPYKSYQPITTNHSNLHGVINHNTQNVQKIVNENPIIVFGKPGCCMSHVIKRLLLGLGVNPVVYDVDEDAVESRVFDGINWVGKENEFPAVFIGGELFGGLDKIMATHITGELVPVLKRAGALWL